MTYPLLYAVAVVWDRIPWAVFALLLWIPLTYLLLAVIQLLLLAQGTAEFESVTAFLIPNRDAVLICPLVGAILMLKTAGGQEFDDFLAAASIRFPLMFLLSCIAIIPTEPTGRVLVGVVWGVVTALSAIVFTTVVDDNPVADAWVPLAFIALGMITIVVVGSLGSFGDAATDDLIGDITLQAIPAGVLAAALTYLGVCLFDAAWQRGR
jgi:hypothetical protein